MRKRINNAFRRIQDRAVTRIDAQSKEVQAAINLAEVLAESSDPRKQLQALNLMHMVRLRLSAK